MKYRNLWATALLLSSSRNHHFARSFSTAASSPHSSFNTRKNNNAAAVLPSSSSSKTSSILHHRRSFSTSRSTITSSLLSTSTSSSTMETTTTTAEDSTTTTIMDAGTKLGLLRNSMNELNLDVYLIPTDDPHLSEYVPAAYMRRAFLSGFQGSAGTAVVTATNLKTDDADAEGEAYLWTDSRYWNEANLQLDAKYWQLQKAGLPSTLTIPKWLCEKATEHHKQTKKQLRIGLDPYVHAASFCKEVEELLEQAQKDEGFDELPGMLVTDLPQNLIDPIWADQRPAIPTSPFRIHPLEYAGKSVADKIQDIRKAMVDEKKATATIFCTLDDVAYVANIRAKGDIETCPVGIAYMLVTLENVYLYCDPAKIVNIQNHLDESNITPKPYDDIVADIQAHCEQDKSSNKVWIDKSRANYALCNAIPEKQCIDSQNAVTPMKSVKNDAELHGMREAHIVDGVAMANFMSWLEQQIVHEQRQVSEVEIDDVLTGYRAKQPGFIECSFPTIAGVGSNGAIIHYRASDEKPELLKYLDTKSPILIDSGGQYTYGTTDVTRTWSFQSEPNPEFVDYYTRVLKGNIGMDVMVFPENTPGFVLDVYARRWLWDAHVDYGHGTGHGVGAALNVHEGPQSISPRWTNKEVLKAGMVLSNEPGYYEDGNFGIRIENLLEIGYVEEYPEGDLPDGKKKFLQFRKLTMIPIQKNLINVNLMTDDELDWLDNYHAEVLEKVGSRLEDGSPAKDWLVKSCAPIDRTRN